MYSMSGDAIELPVGGVIRKKTNLQVGFLGSGPLLGPRTRALSSLRPCRVWTGTETARGRHRPTPC
jgi:hypothetical protein